jgi:hypothetical protein
LDARANPELARMLIDYARERTAAHRTVAPELWHCVAPFTDEATLAELKAGALSWDTFRPPHG